MPIYLIWRTDPSTWEENVSLVVRAENKQHCREIASKNHGAEGPDIWFATSTCVEVIRQKGHYAVLCKDNRGS